MRPPAIVSDPYPAQARPWVHRCAKHGCRMVEREGGGIECPVCAAAHMQRSPWTAAPALDEVR